MLFTRDVLPVPGFALVDRPSRPTTQCRSAGAGVEMFEDRGIRARGDAARRGCEAHSDGGGGMDERFGAEGLVIT
ncbi:hypothetical protein Ahu01nite_004900 [Winogradskya humida]|uniref:Uncharacterized protein n=1 Tax=Winogradskya humida TaxID=113566 RepID=A0ABQ3ZFM3_9ACTN|nr:hypothetical protein Ahu01nite_004900 [Actinoplanes humidus]